MLLPVCSCKPDLHSYLLKALLSKNYMTKGLLPCFWRSRPGQDMRRRSLTWRCMLNSHHFIPHVSLLTACCLVAESHAQHRQSNVMKWALSIVSASVEHSAPASPPFALFAGDAESKRHQGRQPVVHCTAAALRPGCLLSSEVP